MAVPSNEPVRILSPSALKFSDTIYPSWPFKVECSFPVSRSQSLAVWSIDPVAQRLLWGSNATATTSFWWPANVYKSFPESVSHSLAVQSKLPVTILSLRRFKLTQKARWRRASILHFCVLLVCGVALQFLYPKFGKFYRNYLWWTCVLLWILVTIFIEATVSEGEDVCLESFEEGEILIFLFLEFEDELWVFMYVLSIRDLSWGFLLSVIMGSSLAISSTSSSTSVLSKGDCTLQRGSTDRWIWFRLHHCCAYTLEGYRVGSIAVRTFWASFEFKYDI